MLTNEEIIKNLKSEDEYLKELKQLHDELGIALFTGTLIKDEAENLALKMFEKIAIVEFIRSRKKQVEE